MKTGILILAILMVIKPIVPVLDYAINYDYISKVLCINKADPKSCCKGKCHLKKQLNEVFDDTAASNTSGKTKSAMAEEVISIYCFQLPAYDFRMAQGLQQKEFNPFQQELYSFIFQKDLFHPPAFSV